MGDEQRDGPGDGLNEVAGGIATSPPERPEKRDPSQSDGLSAPDAESGKDEGESPEVEEETALESDEAEEPGEPERPEEFDELGEPPLVDPVAEARLAAPPPPEAESDSEAAVPVPTLPDLEDDPDEAWKARWFEVVRPYLARLASHLEERGIEEHTISVPMGGSRLMLNPEEQRLITDFAGGDMPGDRRALLLLLGVGLLVKIVADLRKLGKVQGEDRHVLVQMLASDAELGYELQRELVSEAKMLASVGLPDKARALTDCQRRLTDRVTRADKASGGDPVLRSGPKPKVDEFEGGPAHDLDKLAAEAEEEQRQRESKPSSPPGTEDAKKQRDPRVEMRKRIVLALLVVALAGAVASIWYHLPRDLDSFSLSDLGDVPAVVQVVNRPPDFLVMVDDQEWDSLSVAQKQVAVLQVADVVRAAGYRRVEFRSMSRSGLAEWTRRGGVKVH